MGLSEGTTEVLTLKALSRNVAGLSEDSTDIFLSQISMLTAWDILLGGVNVGAHELLKPSELGESAQENTKQTLQLKFDCKTRESRNSSHKLLPRLLFNSCGAVGPCPSRENSLDRLVGKLENGLCGWNTGLNEKTGESLEQIEKREGITGSDHSGRECLEKRWRSLSVMCWDMNFLEEWMCSLTVMAPKVVGAACPSKSRPTAGLCATRKTRAMYGSSRSLHSGTRVRRRPPKTHADAGLFLLLKAAELSREWQREHCGGSAGGEKGVRTCGTPSSFQGDETTKPEPSPFSMALMATIWNGSCMKARLGTVLSNKVQMSLGLPQGAPESVVLRDLMKSWTVRKLPWSLDDFVLAAICCADDVVWVAASSAAAEVMVAEVIGKLKEFGFTVGSEKTHWTSQPKMMDTSIRVDGLAVLWEEVEFVGSKVCLY